jgi:pSer/pThr/pTyr-binding forkhead associated (FHA) protein
LIHLLVTLGDDRREVKVEKPMLTIGRSAENDLPLADRRASRRHARIEVDELGFRVCDLASANGTWLNRRRVASDRLLPGDELRVGRAHILVLKLLPTAPCEARPRP